MVGTVVTKTVVLSCVDGTVVVEVNVFVLLESAVVTVVVYAVRVCALTVIQLTPRYWQTVVSRFRRSVSPNASREDGTSAAVVRMRSSVAEV